MKDIADVLGHFIQSGTSGIMLCLVLQYTFRYKALALEKGSATTCNSSGEGGSQRKESGVTEFWPALKIENSTLQYIYAHVTYQRSTVVMHAAKTSVVEMYIHFWLYNVPFGSFSVRKP